MIPKEDCRYCNFCKYYIAPDWIGDRGTGCGICNSKPDRVSNHMLREFWWEACERFEYSVHNMYGIESLDFIEEYKAKERITPPIRFIRRAWKPLEK